ncbi:hypothetical protein [Plesiomonas shigelloides]|uniref:hypothetical protein n=1 Tax=Plesiomonas shigelloides TaxID=703 RepID=UPI001262A8A9|nr:hypothetical protein [Plesiomonas shigelloides]KAB7689505.1 hypothetical protein GBN20_07640 [Plesiomonas shigelloides]
MSWGGARSGAGRKPGEKSKMTRVPESLSPLIAELISRYRSDPDFVLSNLPLFLSGQLSSLSEPNHLPNPELEPNPEPEPKFDSDLCRSNSHAFFLGSFPLELHQRFDKVMHDIDCSDFVYAEICKRFSNVLLNDDSDPIIFNVRMMRNWVRQQLEQIDAQ